MVVVVVVVKRTRMMINYKYYMIDSTYIFTKVFFFSYLEKHLTVQFTYLATWHISHCRGGEEKAIWSTSKVSGLKVCFLCIFCRLFSLLREVLYFILNYLPLVLTLLQCLTNGSHTYFPKFSPSSSVSGSTALAVSGSKIHSSAPNNGPSPKVSGGTKKANMFCKSNRQKFQNLWFPKT